MDIRGIYLLIIFYFVCWWLVVERLVLLHREVADALDPEVVVAAWWIRPLAFYLTHHTP
jgi:hypothetical protein